MRAPVAFSTPEEMALRECGGDVFWMMVMKKKMVETAIVPLDVALTNLLPGLKMMKGYENVSTADILEISKTLVEQNKFKLRTIKDGEHIDPMYAACIQAYTMERPPFYKVASSALHDHENRFKDGMLSSAVEEVFFFMKLFDVSLASLPPSFHFQGLTYRGLPHVFPSPEKHEDLYMVWFEGRRLWWNEPKSTSIYKETAMQFCTSSGVRTLQTINVTRGYKIAAFSDFPEGEIVLPMMSELRVGHVESRILVDKSKADNPRSVYHIGEPDSIQLFQMPDAAGGPCHSLSDSNSFTSAQSDDEAAGNDAVTRQDSLQEQGSSKCRKFSELPREKKLDLVVQTKSWRPLCFEALSECAKTIRDLPDSFSMRDFDFTLCDDDALDTFFANLTEAQKVRLIVQVQ